MSTLTENDLRELKDLINSRFNDLDTRMGNLETHINNLETRMSNLEQGQTEIQEKITGFDKRLIIIDTRLETWKPAMDKIPDLAEKVGELKNWRQIVPILITASISGGIGWLIRGGSLNP